LAGFYQFIYQNKKRRKTEGEKKDRGRERKKGKGNRLEN